MTMMEALVKPGSGPTYHSHAREDETFYVVSGTAEVWIDREIFRCEAGDRSSVHATCSIHIATPGTLI